MSRTTTFCFTFGGFWQKVEGTDSWSYDDIETKFVNEITEKMTFEWVCQEFSKLGFPNPKNIYVHDLITD